MASVGPPNGIRLASNGGSPAPVTPRGHASKEVNVIIESIAQEFGLPLKSRGAITSPSKRPDNWAERCVDHINFLFFRNRIELNSVIETFRNENREGLIHEDLLLNFYGRTRDAVYLEKNKPVGHLHLDPIMPLSQEFKKPAIPQLSLKQTQLIPQIKKGGPTGSLKVTDSPFLPSLDSAKGIKRASGRETPPSSKYVRPQKKRRQQPRVGDHSISCKFSTTNPSLASTANPTYTPSIFSGQRNDSFATTVATSFGTTDDEFEFEKLERPGSQSSSAEYGDLDIGPSQVEKLMTSFEQPNVEDHHQPEQNLLRTPTDADTKAANLQLQVEQAAAQNAPSMKQAALPNVPSLKLKKTSLEHRLVRSLPTDGLFCPVIPTDISSSFSLLWECFRAANAVGKPFQYFSDQNELYQHFPEACRSASYQRTPASVWEALKDPSQAANVIYKGNLAFNTNTSADTLFNLTLQPLKCERASRLQRKFDSDRFLYLEMPQISYSHLPSRLRGQSKVDQLKDRFREWMCMEKEFLGRKWRVFHIQDIKKKASQDKIPAQRLVLFAVNGPGIQPIGIKELLNWAIPLAKNSRQGFCKAYARLDLFLSQTIPTLIFKPSEVKFIPDTIEDGTPECTTFNDPGLVFRDNPFQRPVMNDGCSIMSVGAAKEICELLGIKGVRPVAFQGRINGHKGVWSVSAPYDTTNPKHLKRWIHVTESQRKITPRKDDEDDNKCEAGRWSFELVKATSPPRVSALNLEFIPILEDRHVSRDTLQEVIESQLQMDFAGFLESLDDPVALRRWIHSEFSVMEEIHRVAGIREVGNHPAEWVEKTILLLESGFGPTKSKYLAGCVEHVTKLWLSSMRQKLKIPLGRSTMALGIADPTGCLRPGEIHMAFSETFRDESSGEAWSHLKGEVLVARHPSLRRSDVQKVKAVYKEELSHLIDVVVFPSKGCIPLAHKLQGGDYDGDTFWLCWDPRLTTDFKNAPAPTDEPKLEYFGIKKDARMLGELLGNNTDVDRWLSESFKFKLQEDLLGQATNYHKKLAYRENCISSAEVEKLADLHDLVIDSAKHGYTFSFNAFKNFTKKTLGIKKEPSKPAYETWMEPTETGPQDNDGHLMPNLKHIIDYLLFRVVNPEIEYLTKRYQEKLASAETVDPDLEAPFRERQQSENPIVKDVLKQLIRQISDVNFNGSSINKMTKETYSVEANRSFEGYAAIQPCHTADPLIQEWLKPVTPFGPSTWDLIKASALYTERHVFKSTLAFLVAGKELCYIKAHSMGGSKTVVGDIHAILKPRKEKKTFSRRQAPLPVAESESSEDEFSDCPS